MSLLSPQQFDDGHPIISLIGNLLGRSETGEIAAAIGERHTSVAARVPQFDLLQTRMSCAANDDLDSTKELAKISFPPPLYLTRTLRAYFLSPPKTSF